MFPGFPKSTLQTQIPPYKVGWGTHRLKKKVAGVREGDMLVPGRVIYIYKGISKI